MGVNQGYREGDPCVPRFAQTGAARKQGGEGGVLLRPILRK